MIERKEECGIRRCLICEKILDESESRFCWACALDIKEDAKMMEEFEYGELI